MPSYIHHIATGNPEICYQQDFIMGFMKKHVGGDRLTDTILHRVYTQSQIKQRHSVLTELDPIVVNGPFIDPENGKIRSPGTGIRNELYVKEARKLFTSTAQKVFDERPDLNKNDITHIITVSCTGFYAPGPDIDVINALSLPPNTQRYHIGFMGCYAAVTALRLANTICNSNENAHVLVVACELCTLHLKFTKDTDSLLSAAVFADGCAAAYVSSKKPDSGKYALEIVSMASTLTPNGAEDMAWSIGNNGFDMVLSTYIPDLIESNLDSVLGPIWEQNGTSQDQIDIWAVHPGGRAIVDKVVKSLELTDEQIASSRNILRDYGNMSSPTILFVLNDIMQQNRPASQSDSKSVIAMSFGPGLTVESGLMNYIMG